MAQAAIYNMEGKEVGKQDLSKELFDVQADERLLHQVIVSQDANARVAIAHTKDRSEVRGGGKKPWRQKGTGRARHGSIRSPIWRGGGITFGPRKNRNFSKKVNRKVKRKALAMVLTDKASNKAVLIVEGMKFDGKTKQAAAFLKAIAPEAKRVLMVLPDGDNVARQATGNLQKVETATANGLNVRDVLVSDVLILPVEALKTMEETYTDTK